jgi:5,10-methylenetetrahydrofolate reductase
MAGIELQGSPQFYVGTTVDAGASGGLLEMELENLRVKIEKGARFVVTTPIFDIRRFQAFLRRLEDLDVAIIPTVLLLKSAGMARYIDRNIRSISIPSELIRGIQKAPDKRRECIRIAGDLAARFKEMGMAGVLISTLGWEERLPMVLDQARL